MQSLVKEAKQSTEGDLDMNWIKPFTKTRDMSPGEVLFRKGEEATEIIFVMSGSLHIPELGVRSRRAKWWANSACCRRTASARNRRSASTAGSFSSSPMTRCASCSSRIPKFGYYFMQLSTARLFENMKRMQIEIERLRAGAQVEVPLHAPPLQP